MPDWRFPPARICGFTAQEYSITYSKSWCPIATVLAIESLPPIFTVHTFRFFKPKHPKDLFFIITNPYLLFHRKHNFFIKTFLMRILLYKSFPAGRNTADMSFPVCRLHFPVFFYFILTFEPAPPALSSFR